MKSFVGETEYENISEKKYDQLSLSNGREERDLTAFSNFTAGRAERMTWAGMSAKPTVHFTNIISPLSNKRSTG